MGLEVQEKTNFLKELSVFNFVDKYAQLKEDGSLETFEDAVDRIWAMNKVQIDSLQIDDLSDYAVVRFMISEAAAYEKKKKFLSSQRARQWGSVGKGILDKNERQYNCCGSLADRVEVFGHFMYLLLCGCGVGMNVMREHVNKLPVITAPISSIKYCIADTIEGWADAVDVLMNSYMMSGVMVDFDYSKIRMKGSVISGRFIHGGHKPLMIAIEKARDILNGAIGRQLKVIEVYDICCHLAEAVLSGGVRRSATIFLFDNDEKDMLEAKVGDWYSKNPQRAMSNISAVFISKNGECEDKDGIKNVVEMSRVFGEPAPVFLPSPNYVLNPCGEILMNPVTDDGRTGFQFCNLTEINLSAADSKEDLMDTTSLATFSAMVQATYNKFPYLGAATKDVVDRDCLIGVSVTGYMNSELAKDEASILSDMANEVMVTSDIFSEIFGLNRPIRCTTVKPSGNASILLETTNATVPHHSRKYLRHVRIPVHGDMYRFVSRNCPEIVVDVSDTTAIVAFPITVGDDFVVKSNLKTKDHLDRVEMLYNNWVSKGSSVLTHNVSSTIPVSDGEWDVASDFVCSDKAMIGMTFIGDIGDRVYPFAPNFAVKSIRDIKNEFSAFSNRLICDIYTRIRSAMSLSSVEWTLADITDMINNSVSIQNRIGVDLRDFYNDLILELYSTAKFYHITDNYSKPDFFSIKKKKLVDIGEMASVACSGGSCSI